jgi:hypothetical protein
LQPSSDSRLRWSSVSTHSARIRRLSASEDKAFYNWARVEPFPLLGDEFVRELTRRANALTTMKLQLADTLRAFNALKGVPEFFRRFLSQYLGNAFGGVDHAIDVSKQSVCAEAGFAKRWSNLLPADKAVLRWVALGEGDLHGSKSLAIIGQALKLRHSARLTGRSHKTR